MAESRGEIEQFDSVIVGAGPAGLSAALNLARSRTTALVVDSNRPRNAATLASHGFITRDGISPIELRTLARAELEAYPEVEYLQRATVSGVARDGDGSHPFATTITRGSTKRVVASRTVLLATGVREILPDIPSLRGFYGMSLFSCAACDGYERKDQPLALIGETPDLHDRALLVARWSSDLTVFTNGAAVVTPTEETGLVERGIRVERGQIDDVEGVRGSIAAVRLINGERIPVTGGFVRPVWVSNLDFIRRADRGILAIDPLGGIATDRDGRTSIDGLYASGDIASPGPQQLIVAAGAGARTAAIIVHDLIGVTTSH
jgi:thioredoxin reductase